MVGVTSVDGKSHRPQLSSETRGAIEAHASGAGRATQGVGQGLGKHGTASSSSTEADEAAWQNDERHFGDREQRSGDQWSSVGPVR